MGGVVSPSFTKGGSSFNSSVEDQGSEESYLCPTVCLCVLVLFCSIGNILIVFSSVSRFCLTTSGIGDDLVIAGPIGCKQA